MIESGFVDFVKEWGYLAVFLGSIVEGESVLLAASALAAFGYLSIYQVFFVALLTTVFVDQALFFVGRKIGADFIMRKFPKTEGVIKRIFGLLHRMDVFFILSFRFVYGVRTISPFVIGAAKIPVARFMILNLIAGFVWAGISCCLGFWIADLVMANEISLMPAIVIVTVLMILLSLLVGKFVRFREKK